jgi:CubicO group peptidase (beta-lactamase class C family)
MPTSDPPPLPAAMGRLQPRAVRRAAALWLAAVSWLSGCASLSGPDVLTPRVDALLAPLVDARQFSGAVVLSRDGRTLYERGFGLANHAAGLPFTPRTPADGASMAKTFTAAGLWLLVTQGQVDLDAPVTRYVPEYPHAATTVRHLLTHSNGLPTDYAFFDPHFGPDQVRTTLGLLQVVAREAPQPRFEPGTRFEYSDLGFDVAALVIERVTGLGFEAFLRQRFFGPLGMTDSFARTARLADWPGVRTLGYRWRDGAWQLFDVYDMEAFLGASNLYFSTRDLARWADALATGSALPAAVAARGQPRPRLGGQPSAINGLSWYCDDAALRCHYTGILNAFHSFVYWDRSRRESVAFFANSSLPPWQTITLQRQLVAALAGREGPMDPPGSVGSFNAETRSAVAGDYSAPGLGRVQVAAAADGLSIRVDCGLQQPMFQVAPEIFYVPGTDQTLAFGPGPQPATLRLRSMFADVVGQRVADGGAQPGTDCPAPAANPPSR